MTQDALISLVREIRSLERVEFLVQRTLDAGGASAWRYALTALDDRLRWCRYVASLEHPHAVSMAEELVRGQDERAANRKHVSDIDNAKHVSSLPDLPKAARVH